MNKTKYIGMLAALMLSSYALGNDDIPYVDGSKAFVLITDVNRQAEAWGTCSATYDVMAMLLAESNPAQAEQYKNLGRDTIFT